jgi:hypothetical protein
METGMQDKDIPKYAPLSRQDAETLLQLGMLERQGYVVPDEDLENFLLAQIVKRRIDVMNLPVKYTNLGLAAIGCFAHNPGQAVALLVDFLTKYENGTITVENLCELYPFGFYNEDSFTDYVDNKLKTRSVKWAEIY